MADSSNGGKDRRFAGTGNDAPTQYKAWKKWAKARIVVEKSKGTDVKALGPLLFTLLDGDAADALDHVDIDDLAVEGGADIVFAALDARFPEREAADRVGDALESAFGLKIEKGELTAGYCGRARTVFQRAAKEGVDLPDVAQGFLLLKGSRLGGDRRAVVLAASERSWTFDKLALALKTTYLRF